MELDVAIWIAGWNKSVIRTNPLPFQPESPKGETTRLQTATDGVKIKNYSRFEVVFGKPAQIHLEGKLYPVASRFNRSLVKGVEGIYLNQASR